MIPFNLPHNPKPPRPRQSQIPFGLAGPYYHICYVRCAISNPGPSNCFYNTSYPPLNFVSRAPFLPTFSFVPLSTVSITVSFPPLAINSGEQLLEVIAVSAALTSLDSSCSRSVKPFQTISVLLYLFQATAAQVSLVEDKPRETRRSNDFRF